MLSMSLNVRRLMSRTRTQVSECFAVPFTEKTEELYVAINQDYHKLMYAFHRRNNKKEVIVGWYTTTTQNGQYVTDNSSLINDFYSSECTKPIHLVVDTTLSTDTMSVRGFVCKPTIVGDEMLANAFQELTVDIGMTDAEATCIYHMIQSQDTSSGGGEGNTGKWANSVVVSELPSNVQQVDTSIENLQRVLDDIQSYVDGVVEGIIPPSREIGIAIADALNSFAATKAQLAQQQQQQQQAPLKSRVQDLLMVSHITTLTQTQTLISEKLNEVV